MPEPRLLIKTAASAQAALTAAPLSLDGAGLQLRPLFAVAPAGQAAPGLAAAGGDQWFTATPTTDLGLAAPDRAWDVAHRLFGRHGRGMGVAGAAGIIAVEPDLEQTWPPAVFPDQDGEVPARAGSNRPVGQTTAKGAIGPGFAWHLTADFTGLAAARKAAGHGLGVTIAHLDTGYDPEHLTRPENLAVSNAWNFVDEDRPRDATDRTPQGGLLRNRGHGTGTLGILAGARLDNIRPAQGNTGDYLGAAPLATIVPMRVADSVVHFWTSTIAAGFDKARELGVDVLSMSMGGIASQAWADAVNAAYESGVVMVCAAGNNFNGLPTPNLVYPARFDRVIAACGVMANGLAYHELEGWRMEGNAGPAARMRSAMAAFTPNVPWPRLGKADIVDHDGGGTSAATPQIAAAAALWLARHGNAYGRDWQRVEAVRKALFETAARRTGSLSANDAKGVFGRGVLRATDALTKAPADLGALKQTRRDSARFSFLRMLTGLGAAGRDPRDGLFELELAQLIQTAPALAALVPDTDGRGGELKRRQARQFVDAVLEDGRCSQALTGRLRVGQGTRRVRPTAGATRMPRVTPRRDGPRPPATRRLRVFAFDPSLGTRQETAAMSEVVTEVPWETDTAGKDLLKPGPVGEYLEVVDVDPASGLTYAPVDLDQPYLLATDGLAPSEGNPQFHQQMVYAVAMKTIGHFERALGRTALWATRPDCNEPSVDSKACFVRQLRVYPHALRQANAFYSPAKVALLFGYFPETRPGGRDPRPGGMVFTCLSHDIIAHETTHALLDGLHRRYKENTNPDTLAFHEAFADIVAIFQHFTYREILRHEIGRARADLEVGTLLSDLARQFGEAMGYSAALRSAIGVDGGDLDYLTTPEPHDRGSILVAAVFRAFTTIYRARTADLLRIATGGSGVLAPGALPSDLVNRLADEAARAAGQVLNICIRALDYCPPVDLTFSDYLRALITADTDTVAADRFGYRVAFLEAFRHFHIYPERVRTISVESLMWSPPDDASWLKKLWKDMGDFRWDLDTDRLEAYVGSRQAAFRLHGSLMTRFSEDPARASQIGLDYTADETGKPPPIEVHSVRQARRTTSDGRIKTDVVAVITQSRTVPLDESNPALGSFRFRGGCTLIVNPEHEDPVRYAVIKNVNSARRLKRQRDYLLDRSGSSLRATYFAEADTEPFAMLHQDI